MGIEIRPKYENESIESMIRRFQNKVKSEGILEDLRKNEYYEKPSMRKRKKRISASRRKHG